MTPRTQIVSVDLDDPADTLRRKIADSQHSRFPVIQGDFDNVVGMVRAKDLLAQSLAGQPLDIRALLRPPLFVPESTTALKALELLKQQRVHMALVTDEYGGIQGLLTHNDILEDIAGRIPSANDPTKPQAVRREDGSWLVDGLLHIDELKEIFDLSQLPAEAQGRYQTVGGFVMTHVRRIPVAGQHFEWGGLRFEVVDMDGRRVDKVLVTPLSPTHL
jgi:putative hemolysin